MVYNYESQKKWRAKNPEKWRDYNNSLQRNHHKILVDLLGGHCVLCHRATDGTKHSLIVHEIHGKSHPKTVAYVSTHIADFVLLCRPHHAMLHRMKNEGVLEVLLTLIKGLVRPSI